jgi:hypothetical protein
MRAIQYQEYTIQSYPRRLPKDVGWTIKISISWKAEGDTKVKEYSADSPFLTEAEADTHGIAFGQRIIDNKITGLTLK